MFRIFLFIFCIICLACPALYAQDERADALEKERNTINLQIQKGDFLLNELKINANRLPMPQKVEYLHTEKYFYNFDRKGEGLPKPILKAVIIKTEKATETTYTEYMFDNAGSCIFFAQSVQDYQNAIDERLRIFIEAGKPIRWYKNDTDITYDTEKPEKATQKALKSAKNLQNKFLKQVE